MTETNSSRPAPIPGDAIVDDHPLQHLTTPHFDHIIFLGYGLSEQEVRGFIRLVGWELIDGCGGSLQPNKLMFLRKVMSEPDPEEPKEWYRFFEIGISGRAEDTLYVIGGEVCGRTPQTPFQQLASVFDCLSQLYEVEVEERAVSYAQAHEAEAYMQRERERSQAMYKKSQEAERRKEKLWPHFRKGQKAVWSTQAFHGSLTPQPKKSDILIIIGVEIIPNHCSCGLGDDVRELFHREDRCNLYRRYQNMHHQVLTVQLGRRKQKVSGHYLFPFEAL